MYAKEHGKMRRTVRTMKNGDVLLRADVDELLRYVCPNPIFSMTLESKAGEMILHISDLATSSEAADTATLADARLWMLENFVFLTSLEIDQVQCHLAPRPIHNLFIPPRKALERIKAVITAYLLEYEKNSTGKSWPEYIAREAGADGLIALVGRMYGPQEWGRMIRDVMVGTGRYREDGDAIVRV